MDGHKLAIPLLAFAGGAILGRVLGLKTLMRGAMTAAAVTGLATQPAVIGPHANGRAAAHRRKPVQRSAHRKSPQKKSASA
jgi:hypothetical protein